MELQVGEVVEGRVTGITNFGAFVALPGGKSGLVHISEIANTYVSDIHEHVKDGESVKVKILQINPDGKINLSIKQTQPPKTEESRGVPQYKKAAPIAPAQKEAAPVQEANESSGDSEFEERLKRFMKESNSRIADNPLYNEHKQRGRRH